MSVSMVAGNGGLAVAVFSVSALAQSFTQASGIQIGVGLLKPVAKLLGAGLVLWPLVATYGLDLSPGLMDRRLKKPAVIVLPMTRGDIADYLGITMETVSRSLSAFRDRAIISFHGHRGHRQVIRIGQNWLK
jgi:hypothetical protein